MVMVMVWCGGDRGGGGVGGEGKVSLRLTGEMDGGVRYSGGDGGGDDDDAMDSVQHRGIDIVTYNVRRSKSHNGFQS